MPPTPDQCGSLSVDDEPGSPALINN
jgi:hypothetical protein